MILTRDVIIEEVNKGTIKIEPFYYDNVGPASVDLHLGHIFRLFRHHNDVFPVKENARVEEITELLEIKEDGYLLLEPSQTVLGITQEKITLPGSIAGWIEGRSRFARIGLGIHITSGFTQPGISNHQVLEITNLSPNSLALYPGTKICQLVFQRCDGTAKYSGIFASQRSP